MSANNNRMFIDVNVIQTMPPSCVNRDDTGSPKTCMYGGVRRARVSSQSWKKATRDYFHSNFDQNNLCTRTKKVVDLISERILELDDSITPEDSVKMAADILAAAGVKTDVKKEKKKKGGEEPEVKNPETGALFFISDKQVDCLAKLSVEGEKDKKKAKEALNRDMGVEIALFGRMVADDPSLNSDASVQVAHSISTHAVENEYDYFTALDDMSPDDNAGAGMIGTVEFNSSTMYRYCTIAVHDLESILGSKDAASKAVREFIEAFILSMPTGKQNTFANRTVPYSVLISVRNDQPANLAPAFETPIRVDKESGGFNEKSTKRMLDYHKQICSDFLKNPAITWQVGKGLEELGPSTDLDSTLDSIEKYVVEI